MNKKIVIIGILLVAVLGLILSPYIKIFGEDYGTGLYINTSTKKFEYYGNYYGKGKKFLYTQDYEMLKNVYITSWLPDENSMQITAVAKFNFHQHFVPFDIPVFILGQYAWMVVYEDPNRNMHLIIDGRNNYVDTNYVSEISGNIQGNLPNMIYKSSSQLPPGGNYILPSNLWGSNTWTWYEDDRWHNMETGTISFKIKGNRIGALRVYCIIEYAEQSKEAFKPPRWIAGEVLLVEDWAYLASGIGKVDVLGTNSVRQDGTTRTEPTNRKVPLYVFEEGSTVVFSVDTGYAGAVSGQKGWRLAVYKADTPSPLKVWWLEDDLRGYEITWTIPKGTFTPGGNNRMKVVLTNTIIDQSETTFFVVDRLEKIPGTPQISPDKTKYYVGETATVTLRAVANPNGTGDIVKFYFEAKYDSPSSANIEKQAYVPAHRVSGMIYEGTVTFTVNQGGKTLYLLAWAIDSEGRASGRGTTSVKTESYQGNYKITIRVREPDNTPISDAKVVLGGITKYTDAQGVATIYVPRGTYQIEVSKAGYNTYRETITVNADKTIDVTLFPSWMPPEGNIILVLSLIAVAGIMVFVLIKVYREVKRGKR
ncbi:MAG: hypothetical protein DRN78_00015 [Thermoproteota archaeon]|nr:MAG: hypothetical protein DRN78_00015 [Candidatus Korarchaeota archaeon]